MKKMLSLLLCGALMLPLAACGEKVDSDVTVVKVWTGNGHDKAYATEAVKEWNETKGKEAGIKIEYTVQEGGDLGKKLDLAFISGEAPDIFQGANLATMIENDQIIAIDDLPGGPELMAKYRPEHFIEGRTLKNGKCYTVPYNATTRGLIYNKDMFRAAGLVDENGEPTPPKTLDEMREYAKILTNPEKKEYGIVYPAKWAGWYGEDILNMSMASGSYMDGYNPKDATFDYTKMAPVMKTIMGIKADGSYYPGAENLDNDPARARFAEGGIGMKTAASYDFGVLTEQFPAKIDWGVAPYPSADGQKHYQYMDMSGYLFVNKASVDKIGADKIMTVYNFFYSDEYIIGAYKRGLTLPLRWDIVENVELDEGMEQWKEFASLTEISRSAPTVRGVNADGKKMLPTIWLNEIWSGNIPVDQIDATLADYTAMMNQAAEEYQAQHPEQDLVAMGKIIPTWDTKRED